MKNESIASIGQDLKSADIFNADNAIKKIVNLVIHCMVVQFRKLRVEITRYLSIIRVNLYQTYIVKAIYMTVNFTTTFLIQAGNCRFGERCKFTHSNSQGILRDQEATFDEKVN